MFKGDLLFIVGVGGREAFQTLKNPQSTSGDGLGNETISCPFKNTENHTLVFESIWFDLFQFYQVILSPLIWNHLAGENSQKHPFGFGARSAFAPIFRAPTAYCVDADVVHLCSP